MDKSGEERAKILTKLRWSHWEAFQSLESKDSPLQQQNLGCSHLAVAEGGQIDCQEYPTQNIKTNTSAKTRPRKKIKKKKHTHT